MTGNATNSTGDSFSRRGRDAPSPTGEVPLGNASTALLAWLSIRAVGGTFVMRMEDLDRVREEMPIDFSKKRPFFLQRGKDDE